MTNPKLVKRIITCQGTIQLVTALSVLSYREKQQKDLTIKYQDYLVIYHLYSPPGQIDEFAAFIKRIAELVGEWHKIVYITPEQLSDIESRLDYSSPSKIFRIVHEMVGTNRADEIYLCRNWMFGNKLLINSYKSALKICYGDSIGFYFSVKSKALFADKPEPKPNLIRYIEKKQKALVRKIKTSLRLITYLKIRPKFDIGYFVLPEAFGESPPMKTVTLNKVWLLDTFQKLRGLVNPEYVLQFRKTIAESPVSILLTSNFSEARRMSLENEIAAYREFLITEGIEPNTVLVIKPHPRDDNVKLQKLEDALSELFDKIIILSEPDLFFLPFEVFFAEAFLPLDSRVNNQPRVFAVSTACISLKLLFNVPSIVGFGEQITSKLFYENYAAGRLEHEQELRAAINNVEVPGIITEHHESPTYQSI
ncbi:polysialyltransferase family glycosyltransferase [Moorena producens]|uniref:polysialyltransferase family glycosyltransferase n=1 Tax=Moorena producens TaxID=1155739 RepID=UPI003C746790